MSIQAKKEELFSKFKQFFKDITKDSIKIFEFEKLFEIFKDMSRDVWEPHYISEQGQFIDQLADLVNFLPTTQAKQVFPDTGDACAFSILMESMAEKGTIGSDGTSIRKNIVESRIKNSPECDIEHLNNIIENFPLIKEIGLEIKFKSVNVKFSESFLDSQDILNLDSRYAFYILLYCSISEEKQDPDSKASYVKLLLTKIIAEIELLLSIGVGDTRLDSDFDGKFYRKEVIPLVIKCLKEEDLLSRLKEPNTISDIFNRTYNITGVNVQKAGVVEYNRKKLKTYAHILEVKYNQVFIVKMEELKEQERIQNRKRLRNR